MLPGAFETLMDELEEVGTTESVINAYDLRLLVDKTLDAFGCTDGFANHIHHPPKKELLEIHLLLD